MGVGAVSLCFSRRAGRGRGRVGRSHLGVGKFVVFLPLHSPILEPDLDLALRQAERVGDLDAAPPGQVAVKMEFLLQLQDLLPGIGGSRALGLASVITGVDGAHVDLLHPGVHHGLLALRARRPLVRQQQRARGGAAPRRDSRGGGAWSAVPRGRGGLRGRAGVRAGGRGLLGSRGAGAAAGVGAGGGGRGVQAPGVAGLARPRRVVGWGLAGAVQVRGRQVRGALGPREAGTPARAAVPTARAAVRRELLEGRELGLDVVGVYQKRAHGH